MAIEGVPPASTALPAPSAAPSAPARPQAPPADLLPVGVGTGGAPTAEASQVSGAQPHDEAVRAEPPVDPASLPPQDPSTLPAMVRELQAQIDARRAANDELRDQLIERQATNLRERIDELSDVLSLASARFRIETQTPDQQIDLIV